MSQTNNSSEKNFLKINIELTPHHFDIEIHHIENFHSHFLNRNVKIDLYLPPSFYLSKKKFSTLYFNDGQDLTAVKMRSTLQELYESDSMEEVLVVGIHAGDRLQEYGTAHQLDYKSRGSKAAAYHQFIVGELMPFLQLRYKSSQKRKKNVFAGFSLGGLSAFDIVWHHHETFYKVGVFSGSFWWRSKDFTPEDPDANRIVIDMLTHAAYPDKLKFWLQTGTKDETDDRNNNGIIDAIDDTLDVIKGLEKLGYSTHDEIKYLEVIDGIHHPSTWGNVLPDFLTWAFKPKKNYIW